MEESQKTESEPERVSSKELQKWQRLTLEIEIEERELKELRKKLKDKKGLEENKKGKGVVK